MGFKFKLGDRVRDTFTGYEGFVHGQAEYITWCNRVGINKRELDKDGKVRDNEWFDDVIVELVQERQSEVESRETGGPVTNPAMRRGV